MWRLLEKGEVPLIGDEVLQSGSLFSWVPVVNNIKSSPVGGLVIRRKIEDNNELGTTPNSAMVPCLDVGAIVNRCTWGPSEKIKRLRELLAQHQ
jgi:hypothetical protein